MAKNPKPVVRAFVPATEKVCGLEIPPINMGHFIALEACGSPLASGGAPASFAEIITALALLTLPSKEARATAGDKAKLSARIDEIAEKVPPSAIKPVSEAIARQVSRAFDTALATKAPEGESASA